MIRAFRITKSSWLKNPFDGEGAKLEGGRWNSIGTQMVYCADSLSLATLEVMANIDDYGLLEKSFSYVPVDIPRECIEFFSIGNLPKNWDTIVPNEASMHFGDTWIAQRRSVVLRVPSVITKNESNYLLNPSHSDFRRLKIGKPERFFLDPRLK